VFRVDTVFVCERGNRPRNAGDARATPAREGKALHSPRQHVVGGRGSRRDRTLEPAPRRDDALAHDVRLLTGRACEVARAGTRHRDDDIEAVEERARKLGRVRGEPLR
jgi:hypothetical protein